MANIADMEFRFPIDKIAPSKKINIIIKKALMGHYTKSSEIIGNREFIEFTNNKKEGRIINICDQKKKKFFETRSEYDKIIIYFKYQNNYDNLSLIQKHREFFEDYIKFNNLSESLIFDFEHKFEFFKPIYENYIRTGETYNEIGFTRFINSLEFLENNLDLVNFMTLISYENNPDDFGINQKVKISLNGIFSLKKYVNIIKNNLLPTEAEKLEALTFLENTNNIRKNSISIYKKEEHISIWVGDFKIFDTFNLNKYKYLRSPCIDFFTKIFFYNNCEIKMYSQKNQFNEII